METRTEPTPVVMAYMDSMIGDVPRGRVLDRPHAPRDARDGQPPVGLLAGAVQRQPGHRPRRWRPRCGRRCPALPLDLRAVPGGEPRRRVRRRPGLRRPVRVRVRPRPDARRPGTPQARRFAMS